MIIYNKDWFDNLSIRKAALRWLNKGMISPEEHEAVKKKYETNYKESGFFARIGMFIFTAIIIGSGLGLFALIFLSHNDKGISIMFIVAGIGSYIASERFVKDNNSFRSGVVDALLYAAIIFINTGIVILLPSEITNDQPLVVFICILPMIVIGALRFADAFAALAAFIVFLIINALVVLKLGSPGKILLPFESMGLSYLIYSIAIKQKSNHGLRFWKRCITVIESASLIAFYLSGNYMTIRKLTESLLDTEIGPGQDIGLAPLFYAFTIVVPLVYIWRGLKLKNYVFLRLGLLLLVAGILSIKYYHSFMPPEIALILSGGAMTLLAYFGIRYLKTPQHGITFETDEQSERHQAMVNIANVAVSQVMSSQPQPVKPTSSTEFGGGDFGGGGAGADF